MSLQNSVQNDSSSTPPENVNLDVAGTSVSELDKRKSSINPDARCPICLTLIADPTILSDCFHIFCFSCIREWLKMKPECPLCKRAPKQIKHNFKLEPNETALWDMPAEVENVIEMRANSEMDSILLRTLYSADVERHAVMQVILRFEEEIRMLQHMAFRSFGCESTYKKAIQELQEEQTSYENLLGLFSTSSRRVIFNEPAFRRVIYLRNLSPRSIVAPEFAVVFNAEYVKSHEELVRSQLMPYILREYSAVSRNECVDVEGLLKVIFDYLENKINRLETISFLKKRGIRHPHQFLNNLAHFAGTGQSLAVYDQNSEYTPRGSAVFPYISGNDDILVLNSAVNNDVQVVGESNLTRLRPNRQTLDRFSRRINELQNRIRDLPRAETTGDSAASSSRRTTTQRSRHRILDDNVVDIGDSSSSNESNDDDVAAIEAAPNTNSRLVSSQSNQSAETIDPFSFASYIFTPTTNDWRRNYSNVSQSLQRYLPANSSTSNICSNLMSLGSSSLFGSHNSNPAPSFTPTNLISILRQRQQGQNQTSSNTTAQFLSDDEDISDDSRSADSSRIRRSNPSEIVALDHDSNNVSNSKSNIQQHGAQVIDVKLVNKRSKVSPVASSLSTGGAGTSTDASRNNKRPSLDHTVNLANLNESVEFMGEVKRKRRMHNSDSQ